MSENPEEITLRLLREARAELIARFDGIDHRLHRIEQRLGVGPGADLANHGVQATGAGGGSSSGLARPIGDALPIGAAGPIDDARDPGGRDRT